MNHDAWSDSEMARFAEFRRGCAIASIFVFASALLVLAIGAVAVVRPDAVFRSPVIVFLIPAFIWIALNLRAPWQWRAARHDLREGGVETVTGPARLRQQHRPGLFALPRDRLLVGDRVFKIGADLADIVIPGRNVTIRYAPYSGALLSVAEAANAGEGASVTLDEPLTRRERELLAQIAEGLTDKEIARRLNLSPATVRTYNSALYHKLGVTRRTQAIRVAAGLDLTSVD